MRFSIIAAAVMATAVSAGSTLYVTEEVTITSCAPTVTNCPARSTVTSTTSYAVTTSAPVVYQNTSIVVPTAPIKTTPVAGVPASSPVSLSTLTISTCIPTVIYSTITVKPTTKVYTPAPSSGPSISGVPGNGTSPTVPSSPQFTGAASSIQVSAFVAVAGVAAFFLA